jgi:hypothetical protein
MGLRRLSAVFIILAVQSITSSIFAQNAPSEEHSPLGVAFCNLIENFQKYDKTEILTEALIWSSGHEVHVKNPNCLSTSDNDRSASIELPSGWNSNKLGKKLSNILRHDGIARVTFQAVFQRSDGPYGPEKCRFHFVLRRLVSVQGLSTHSANRARSNVMMQFSYSNY